MTQQPSWAIGGKVRTTDRVRSPKPPPRENQIRTAANSTARFVAVPPGNDVAGIPDSIGMLTGYGAVFDQWTEVAARGGNFMEQVSRTAFEGIDPRSVSILYSHGSDAFIGSRPLGPVIDLRSDEYGLMYACALLPTQAALELLPGLQAGLYGSSFRFSITREHYEPHPQRSDYNKAGLPERTVLEAVVFEMGPTWAPAYEGATATATPAAKPDSLTLSSNSTASVAASREPRSSPPPSWALPKGKPARTDWLTKSA